LFFRFISQLSHGKQTILCFLILSLTVSIYFYLVILKDLPDPNRLIQRQSPVASKIYDRSGRLLYTFFDGSEKRTLITLEEIPDFVKQATLAIEDKDFYKHTGFSLQGIFRAIVRNTASSNVQGGSTITQQLINNTLLTPERTLKRKVKEVILSIEAELIFSKDEILQMYLNEVAYGGTAYGIEEASQTYLGKSVKDVNLAEAALLAGLPAAPSKYSPFSSDPRKTILRQHQVLNKMLQTGYILPDQLETAKKEKIILAPQQTNIKAPHFVMYVKNLLVEKYGSRIVEQGGLKITTSLDLKIQQMAEEKVKQEVARLAQLRVSNGAALVTHPQTGEILAMVGSQDYFDQTIDGNVNVCLRPRQPGSSIKVITYALALANNFTPATILPDSPITYYSPGAEPYLPRNYDNRFHGNVSLRTALASSYNVPAVKILAYLGVDKMVDLGRKMGITTWPQDRFYGLSTTLGSAEVKMTDLAVVYGTLANLGMKVPLNPILEIKDSQGKILDKLEIAGERVLSPAVAYLLTDILKDNQARTPAFGPNSLLKIPDQEVAVKTGTTNDKRDNWTIGYTHNFLVASWVGNNDNSPMAAVASGITGASPIWNQIMTELLKNQEKQTFKNPDNLIKVPICIYNSLLPCEGCPTKEEYFLPGTEPTQHCSSEQMKKTGEEEKKKSEDQILEGVSTEN
jgi:1A family penicillin-binding protein